MAKKLKPPVWRTESRRLGDLIPCDDSKNPNTNSDAQFGNLKKSLKVTGYAETIVVDADDKIISGSHRWKALMEMKGPDWLVDVRIPDRKLTKQEFDRYLVAANALKGTWNIDILKTFDVGLLLDIGLDENVLTSVFDDNLSIEDDDIDEIEELERAKTTTIRPGDYFAVGHHRILCGNSEDPAVVKRLIGDTKIDLVNIDFPYNIGLNYDAGLGGKQSYGGHVNDKKSDADYRAFVKNILANAVTVSKADAHYFAWTNETYLGMMQDVFKECGIDFRRLCAWLKGNFNPVPSCAFNKCAEWCSYGTRGKNPYLADRAKNLTEIMNREVDSGNRMIDDVADLFAIWVAKRVPAQDMEHPTMKPPSLYEKALRRTSKPGDAVLDLCSGSGSLGIACESLKRRAFLCDQEPIFCQVAINRLTKLSHEPVKKLD